MSTPALPTASGVSPALDERTDRVAAAATSPPADAMYTFRLYVADHSDNSALARANLSALCNQYLPDRHEIEVVDVFREPVRAHDDDITLTPTLIKLAPLPVTRIVGTLENTPTVAVALGLGGGSL